MATLSRLLVELDMDSSRFSKGANSARESLGKLGEGVGETIKGVAGGMLAASVISGGMGEIKGQIEGAIAAGEEFQQTQLKTNAVFGKGAEDVSKWAEGAATSLGLSNGAAQTSADSFGNLFKNVGFVSGSLPGMSENMTGVVANIAAFNNADPSTVMKAIQSGLAGNMRGLKQYGIVISNADIAQEALRETGKKSAKDLTTQELVQARYNAIMGKTASIQGTVSARANTLAGSSKILHAELANLQEEVGVKLVPAMTQLTIVAIKAVPIFIAIMTKFVIPLATLLKNMLLPSLTLFWNAFKKIADVMILAFKGGKSFTDLLTRIPGPLKPLAQALITISAAVGDLVRAFQAGGLQGLLAELPKALGMLADGFTQLGGVILGFIGDTLSSLVGAFAGLMDKIGLGDFGAAIQNEFAGVVTFITDEITLIGDLIHGRWGKLWGDLKKLAVDAVKLMIDDLKARLALIKDVFSAIPWGEVGAAVLAGAEVAFAFLWSAAVSGIQALAGLDWAKYASDALGKLQDLGSSLLSSVLAGWDAIKPTLIQYASGLVSWILGQIPGIGDGLKSIGSDLLGTVLAGWDAIKPTLQAYASGLISWIIAQIPGAVDGLKQLGMDLLNGVVDGWDAIKPTLQSYASGLVSWIVAQIPGAGDGLKQLGSDLLNGVVAGWDAIKPTLQGYASGLVAWIIAQVPGAIDGLKGVGQDLINGIVAGWDNVKPTLQAYASGIAGWVLAQITDAPGKLLIVGNDLLHGIINGWDNAAPILRAYASGITTWVLGLITDALTKLVGAGSDLITGLNNGMSSAWNLVVTSIDGAIQWVKDQFSTAVAWLNPSGVNIISGLNDGLAAAWGLVTGSISGAIGWIIQQFSDATSWLPSSGSGIISGLNDGLASAWYLVSDSISGAVSGIISPFSDAGSWLSQAGQDIMNGLAGGIQWAWDHTVGPLLSKITGLIPAWKGPPAKDATMLIGAGKLVMQGFGRGLDMGWDNVSRQLGGYTAQVPAVAMAGVGSASGSGGSGSGSGVALTFNGDIVINGANKTTREMADEIMGHVAREIGLKFGV
jgi:hypothetical protein